MNLVKMMMDVIDCCEKEGIKVGHITDIEWSEDIPHKTLGQCTKEFIQNHEQYYSIHINYDFALAGESTIRNTVAHEVLHTCVGCFNHGSLWKIYARKLAKYGYNVTTRSASDFVNFEKFKYVVTCLNCNRSMGYSRRGKAIDIITGNANGYCQCVCGNRSFKVVVNH